MRTPLVVCADIGSSAKGNFAWWASSNESGNSLASLAEKVATALNQKMPVALGFECPLFVAVGEDEKLLTKARPGEKARAWSAGAGCGALATGLVQVPWILGRIRARLIHPTNPYLDWTEFQAANAGLFLWEAFVTGSNKGNDHMADAEIGVRAFMAALPQPRSIIEWSGRKPAIQSLIGLALLSSGWSSDPEIVHRDCLVIAPDT